MTPSNDTQLILHKADTRGHVAFDWLDTYHTFSFGQYLNRDRMNFGMLRVLNDDVIDAGMGFGTHPHDNMEIITIPLSGALEHKDSLGHVSVIKHGDVQVMSAGSGITHSEYNHSKTESVSLLQIWVMPNQENVTPRYDQISLNVADRKNRFQQIVSPHKDDDGVWIHQNAWFHIGTFDKGIDHGYRLKDGNNQVYVFIIQGKVTVNGQLLDSRDGLGIISESSVSFTDPTQGTEILVMEVPPRS